MRFFTKKMVVGGSAVVAAALSLSTVSKMRSGEAPQQQLSASEFNAAQDQSLLADAMARQNLPTTSTAEAAAKYAIILYRLRGCPYCAKVEWMLKYHSIRFREVLVDPLTGAGLPDQRYVLAPQLKFSRRSASATPPLRAGPEDHAYLVDSQFIESALAKSLGIDAQLVDPRVVETRSWLTNRFQGFTFAVTNSTWRNAYDGFNYVTPERYHNIFCRMVGASILYTLSKYKIQPRLIQSASTAGTPSTPLSTLTPQQWLELELLPFTSSLTENGPFHGGRMPDIADVEMFAVTRVVDAHPSLSPTLAKGAFGAWQAAMKRHMALVCGSGEPTE